MHQMIAQAVEATKYSNSMSKMTGIKNSYVKVFKKFAQNTRQHCYTKLGKKTQNRHIQVP